MHKILFFLFAVIFILSGCNYRLNDPAYRQHTVKEKQVTVVLLANEDDLKRNNHLRAYIDKNHDLESLINSDCAPRERPDESYKSIIAPLAASMVPSLVKVAFDRQMAKSEKVLDQLKENSSKSYSDKVILSSSEFREKSCALIYRYDPQKTDEIGFMSLLKLDNYNNQGFTFTPIYVKAANTISLSKEAKITASMAMSIKAIYGDEKSWPAIKSVGESSVTVRNIPLDNNSTNSCKGNGESSELIPYLSGDNRLLSVTISVVETGDIGIDIDEKKAELKAIKEAMGPALKDSVKLMLMLE